LLRKQQKTLGVYFFPHPVDKYVMQPRTWNKKYNRYTEQIDNKY